MVVALRKSRGFATEKNKSEIFFYIFLDQKYNLLIPRPL
jgi:hypothetical protein